MKKILVLCLLLSSFCVFAYEETPLLIEKTTVDIDMEKSNNELIDTTNMKKNSAVEKAKKNALDINKNKIRLDQRQLQHERALDYSTKQQNMMLPLF